ncbi:MAG: ECF transporter S component [Candidatus Bathyarchaeia archaeon]
MKSIGLTKQLSATAIFSALVCVATVSFTVYVPSTKGYFNIGETMVYTAAILFGPFVGAFAGGVGSMFADILLGYYYYAPATLVVKAVEGFVVGFLSRRGRTLARTYTKWELKFFTVEMGALIGALLSIVGFLYYSGFVELYSSVVSVENPTSYLFIPAEFWFVMGALAFLLIAFLAFYSEPEYGFTMVLCIFGGLLMVFGYFLYEQFFLGVFAFAEVPINIGQMTIGLVAAALIVKVVKRTMPQFKS